MSSLIQDLRYAIRTLARSPGFTVVAVLTLALGIGANTAIFSVVDAVLLRPVPYPEPDQIVWVMQDFGGGGMGALDARQFMFLRERCQSCDEIATSIGGPGKLSAGGHVEHLRNLEVTARYFDVLGVPPHIGPGFTEEDEQQGRPRTVVLSHDVWRRLFAADPDVLGQSVRIGGRPHSVVGVMPSGFRTVGQIDLWTPLRIDFRGAGANYQVIARLGPDWSRSQAQSEFDALSEQFHAEHPQSRKARFLGTGYQRQLGQPLRYLFLVLLGAVGMVLLVACANTACLQLARAADRQREVAVRAAIGGNRWRIVRQFLTESLVLALSGGALGLLAARWGVDSLLAITPWQSPFWEVRLDERVLAASFLITVLTGILFGLAPALRAGRVDLREGLQTGGSRSVPHGSPLLRRALVVTEVMLCFVLLIGASLLTQTFVNLRNVELGFDPGGVLMGVMPLQEAEYGSGRKLVQFYGQGLSRIKALQGVEGAAVANNIPVRRGLNLPILTPHGPRKGEGTSVDWRYVSPGYLQVLRIPLLRGRPLLESDSANAQSVALVNQEFVDRFFGEDDPIGAYIEMFKFAPETEDRPRQIVGVVGNVKSRGLAGRPRPTMLVPVAQVPSGLFRAVHGFYPAYWIVRTGGNAGELSSIMQEIASSLDPELVFAGFLTMEDVIGESLGQQRFQMVLLTIFAGLALFMAAAGIFGVISYWVTQRTRELGIRMALGASGRQTIGSVVQQGLRLGSLGVALGLLGALALSRTLESFVFGIGTTDLLTFAGVALALLSVAVAASLVPAWWAARLNLVTALRDE